MTEEEQIKYVKKYYENIRNIKNPSEAVQLTAVKKNGWAIQFIENPSEAVQLTAVKQNGLALCYIKNPSEKVIKKTLKLKNNTLILPFIITNNKRVILLHQGVAYQNNISSMLFSSKYMGY